MPRATPGQNYTVLLNDRITDISFQAYGYDKSNEIVDANQGLLAGRPTSLENLPTIYQGDVLWIPDNPPVEENDAEEIEFTEPDEVAIRINGTIFRGWTAETIERSMNTIADAFSFTAPFNPDDPESKFLDPYTYYPCDIFIGGKKYIAGRCEKWNPTAQKDSTSRTIECRSLPAAIIDCPSHQSKVSYFNLSLKEISEIILKPFGIQIEFRETQDGRENAKFKSTKRNFKDKIFSYLQSIGKRRGFVLNSTRDGNIKYDFANLDSVPIMQLVEGNYPLTGITASYDGTKRFSDYKAVAQKRGRPGITESVKDNSIPIHRPTIIDSKFSTKGDIKTSAEWARSRALAASSPVTATVGTWQDNTGQTIKENSLVTLLAPKISIYNETEFLIEKVSLSQGSGGKQAVLTLVLPQAYTTVFPEVFPWSR
jgi:prophage tail gpP-like protein